MTPKKLKFSSVPYSPEDGSRTTIVHCPCCIAHEQKLKLLDEKLDWIHEIIDNIIDKLKDNQESNDLLSKC